MASSRISRAIRARSLSLLLLSISALTTESFAHGFAGKRFFPATLVTDGPFVADELSLPTVSYPRFGAGGDEPASKETAISVDWTKRITENFGIGFGASYNQIEP